jgi:hypothetical protein
MEKRFPFTTHRLPLLLGIFCVLLVSFVSGANAAWFPAALTVVCALAAPLTALHQRLQRFAPVLAALAGFSEGTPRLLLGVAALALLAQLLPAPWRVLTPLLVASGLAYVVYGSSASALYIALAASIAATLAAACYARRIVPLAAAAFFVAVMLLFSAPMLAASDGLPIAAAAAAVSAVVLLAAIAISIRSDSRLPRLVALTASMLILPVPAAFSASARVAGGPSTGLAASANILECSELGADTIKSVECYSAVLIDEFRTNGIVEAINLVDTLYFDPKFGPHFSNNCHEALHFLGKAAALHRGGNLRDVISKGTDMCAAGFGHGVWEMEYGAMSTEVLVGKVPTICSGWEGFNRSEEGAAGIGCRHILGHTLATRYRGHVEDIATVCLIRDPKYDPASDLVQDEIISRNNCLAGLFMENFLDLNRFRTSDIDSNNPFATCEHPKIVADNRLLWGCYNEIGAMVVPRFDYSMPDSLQACQNQAAKRAIPEYVKISCYDSIARAISPALDYLPSEMGQACADVPEGELLTYCVKSIASTVAFDTNDIALSLRLCEEGLVDEAARGICLDRVGQVAASLQASKVAADDPTPSTAPSDAIRP